MLGAAGALCCLATGTAAGIFLRDRRLSRLSYLEALTETLSLMRLMLTQERLSMGELLLECANAASGEGCAEKLGARLSHAADALAKNPLTGVSGAYDEACEAVHVPWEGPREREAARQLFQQLGTGTASMREQAVAACLRRLKPLLEQARQQAEKGGKLCMQVGMLLGLMAGVALW